MKNQELCSSKDKIVCWFDIFNFFETLFRGVSSELGVKITKLLDLMSRL